MPFPPAIHSRLLSRAKKIPRSCRGNAHQRRSRKPRVESFNSNIWKLAGMSPIHSRPLTMHGLPRARRVHSGTPEQRNLNQIAGTHESRSRKPRVEPFHSNFRNLAGEPLIHSRPRSGCPRARTNHSLPRLSWTKRLGLKRKCSRRNKVMVTTCCFFIPFKCLKRRGRKYFHALARAKTTKTTLLPLLIVSLKSPPFCQKVLNGIPAKSFLHARAWEIDSWCE